MSSAASFTPATRPLLDALLVASFLGALVAPTADLWLREDELRAPDREGRRAHAAPELSWNPRVLHHLPGRFEEHFADSFGLRDVLLRWHSLRQLEIFGISPTSDVVLGKQGWMFYTGDRSVETWRGLRPFTPHKLAAWQRGLEERAAVLDALGIAYYFVLGPNKEAVYPDYLPDELNQVGPTRMDQFAEWMAAHSQLEFIDLRPALRAARAQDEPANHLYFEEGTHWNGRGARVAYEEILKRVAQRFPAVAPRAGEGWKPVVWPNAETWRTKMYLERDERRLFHAWLPLDGQPRASTTPGSGEESGRAHESRTADASRPRALLFHDSFGPAVEPLLATHFATLRSRFTYEFDSNEVSVDPPDLVIELFVERTLVSLDPSRLPPPPMRVRRSRDPDWQQRFDAAQDLRWRLDPAADPSGPLGLETTGELEITRLPGALGLRMRTGADCLITPPFAPVETGEALVFLRLSSPAPTRADLLYQRAGAADWDRKQSLTLPLQAGPNEFRLVFPASDGVARFRLRPALLIGPTLELGAFEVRAGEKP